MVKDEWGILDNAWSVECYLCMIEDTPQCASVDQSASKLLQQKTMCSCFGCPTGVIKYSGKNAGL